MPKKEISIQDFSGKLQLLFADQPSISLFLADNPPLQQRYQYGTEIGEFRCKGKKKFSAYVTSSPEKEFYALLNPEDPASNLAQYLSESELVKLYLTYNWAADFAHKHNLATDWQVTFVTNMQQQIFQKEKQSFDAIVSKHQSEWSASKIKLYSQLKQQTAQIASLEQKTHYYHQLAQQSSQKHFYHDGTQQHVFHNYSGLVARYEYETQLQELNEALQPLLYYPESSLQQNNLYEYARHCFFVDADTKELKYINTTGTVFDLPESLLLAKTVSQVKPLKNNKWSLPYQQSKKPHGNQNFEVDKVDSADFGRAFRLDSQMVQALVPKSLPNDPIIKLAEKTVKNTKQHFFSLQRTLSLFGQDHIIAFQHRIAGLIQVREMLQGKTTREIRETHTRPNMVDYMGRGRNTYVFFDNHSDPTKSELWHVDRSCDTPVLTQFPLLNKQAAKFRYLFRGAQSEAPPDPAFDDYETCSKWHQMGKSAQRQVHNRTSELVLRLDAETARTIPQYVLSDMKIYQHLLEDRTYYETSNELIDLLETTEKTPENTRLIQRCRTIHEHLELIEQDRLHSFPDSRGVVPPAKRRKIMQIMIELIRDKNSPEAKHYFRTQHRVYRTTLPEDQWDIDHYEPASFIWDGQNRLCYLNEDKQKIDVTMTDSIRRKLQGIADKPNSDEHHISPNDVYELMTRPRLFYYYCHIPIALDLRWFDYTYYIPLKFDRSQGLHTGTAQEMTREIHDQKLSVTNLMLKLGKVIIFLVIPLILASFGLVIPYPALLGHLGATILEWILMVWNIQFVYEYLSYTLLMNELAHPELNHLDKMIVGLNEDVKKLSDLEQGIPMEDNVEERQIADYETLHSFLPYLK